MSKPAPFYRVEEPGAVVSRTDGAEVLVLERTLMPVRRGHHDEPMILGAIGSPPASAAWGVVVRDSFLRRGAACVGVVRARRSSSRFQVPTLSVAPPKHVVHVTAMSDDEDGDEPVRVVHPVN
jgi:hypothetical protein